jgi:hypothetical protein
LHFSSSILIIFRGAMIASFFPGCFPSFIKE